MTTGTPSLDICTSSSNQCMPSDREWRNAASVFSGASAAPPRRAIRRGLGIISLQSPDFTQMPHDPIVELMWIFIAEVIGDRLGCFSEEVRCPEKSMPVFFNGCSGKCALKFGPGLRL